MHVPARMALGLGSLALIVGGSITSVHAEPAPQVVGHLYVNDNTAPVNTVAGFDRHADGSLTPIPGSPFPAGGSGTGQGIGSQGALQLSSDGRYLLAADAGSGQVSVLKIRPDGSLRAVRESPVSSGGSEPVTIAVQHDLVFVGNSGAESSYVGFELDSGGHLRPLEHATFTLPSGTTTGDVLFSADGAHLVGVRVGTGVGAPTLPSEIDSFDVGDDGQLTPAPGSPFAAQGAGPFGSEFRPTNPSQLFVSNAHDGPGKGTISAYSVTRSGVLDPISGSPFADNQTAPCWVEITHDGKFLFTVNTAVPSISRFSIAGDGTLTLLGSTPFNSPSGLGPEDARLGPSGDKLWVVDTGAGKVSAFAVSGGSLMELPSSPTSLPAGVHPFGIVVD